MTRPSEPLVSVVLPTYNRGPVVTRAINSVLDQSYANLELIVVDDGSRDETANVLAEVRDERFSAIRHPTNLGGGAARNSGIRRAKGAYIAFQDSDDVWHADKLELQMQAFRTLPEEVGVVFSSFRRHRGSTVDVIPGTPPGSGGQVHAALLAGNFAAMPASVIRAVCFERCGLFDERLPRFQDWELFIRLSKQFRFEFVDKPLVDVYFSTSSISADDRALTEALELILVKHEDDFDGEARLVYGEHLFELGHRLCLQGDCHKGRIFMEKAVAISPSAKKALQTGLTRLGPKIYRKLTGLYNRSLELVEP